MMYLVRAGIRAALYRENGNPQGMQMYAEWEETLQRAVRAADRQQDDWSLTPITSIMGGPGDWGVTGAGIGAAWPYGPMPMGG
jgi:hypothetical protein